MYINYFSMYVVLFRRVGLNYLVYRFWKKFRCFNILFVRLEKNYDVDNNIY